MGFCSDLCVFLVHFVIDFCSDLCVFLVGFVIDFLYCVDIIYSLLLICSIVWISYCVDLCVLIFVTNNLIF